MMLMLQLLQSWSGLIKLIKLLFSSAQELQRDIWLLDGEWVGSLFMVHRRIKSFTVKR